MDKRSWSELSVGQRRAIIAGGAVEGVLKIVALRDLAKRPSDQVRGPKVLWALVIIAVNGLGVAPGIYYRFGRRS